MLNPNNRSLYTSALTPPAGMVFDEAIATTFSLDPYFLLEAPVYLALMASDARTDLDPLTILQAVRTYAKKISVYVQKGRILVPQLARPNPMFSFLEEMIVEVAAPKDGVFHPKVWAIRFINPVDQAAMFRLVILTRNMTRDQSWDISLQLEGVIDGRKIKQVNKPLGYFFKQLPDLVTGQLVPEKAAQAQLFSEQLLRVDWELPEGFDEISFFLPGSKKYKWIPPLKSTKMAIISPFCSDEALKLLVSLSQKAVALISRPEALEGLKPETRQLFESCQTLAEASMPESTDADLPQSAYLARGLHAKLYLFETKHNTEQVHIVMGSANATDAALKAVKNVEILVGLSGKKHRVGGVDDLLGKDGLGEYLIAFKTEEQDVADLEKQRAEKQVEDARMQISQISLTIKCEHTEHDYESERGWRLTLIGELPSLKGIADVFVWPISVTQDAAVKITAASDQIFLGEFATASVTGLAAFELRSTHPDVSVRFVLNLPVDGMPEDRTTAIMQRMIANTEGFMRYLLLLLGANAAEGESDLSRGKGFAAWLSSLDDGDDFPILEALTRLYCRSPERFHEISALIQDISAHKNGKTVIPQRFMDLWAVFQSALGVQDA